MNIRFFALAALTFTASLSPSVPAAAEEIDPNPTERAFDLTPLSAEESLEEARRLGYLPKPKKRIRRCTCTAAQEAGDLNDTFQRGQDAPPRVVVIRGYQDIEVDAASPDRSDSPEACREIWRWCR
jgi:hypothetical protein